MNNILVKLYSVIPKSVRHIVGRNKYLKFIRKAILKKKGKYKEAMVLIRRRYLNHFVEFRFYASIKTASKAYETGIENKILTNSIALIDKCKCYNKDCLVIDIGANFGYLSLVWSRTICENQGKVIAFEPNLDVFKTFNKSIVSNDLKNIIISENLAVGSECEKVPLYLDNTTSNTIMMDAQNLSKEIEMVTIDSYMENKKLLRCDLIKIDVDGIEIEILKGCIETINKFKPIFIVETNNDIKIVDFFIKMKYKVLNMDLNEYNGKDIIPLNVFCIPIK